MRLNFDLLILDKRCSFHFFPSRTSWQFTFYIKMLNSQYKKGYLILFRNLIFIIYNNYYILHDKILY